MLIDQELQYASQWYLRDDLVEPTFICLKDNEKKNNFCNPISKKPSEQFVLLDEIRKGQIVPYNYYFESQGTFKHLLWFPENYKKINQISFDNVSFNYHQDNEYVLKNINIKIKAGEVIGISGKSGSGKTTFIDLLLGLLSPNIGSISYNDEILTEKSIKNFKTNFFYIPQDTFLLNDSIATNIILENENKLLNKEKLYYSLKTSRILKYVEGLPKNIEENLGDYGNSLSGGQKQRINLARAVYFSSDILIFDEATNALDKNLELDILNEFIKSFNEKTIRIVSHRKDVLDLCKYVYEINGNQLIKKLVI